MTIVRSWLSTWGTKTIGRIHVVLRTSKNFTCVLIWFHLAAHTKSFFFHETVCELIKYIISTYSSKGEWETDRVFKESIRLPRLLLCSNLSGYHHWNHPCAIAGMEMYNTVKEWQVTAHLETNDSAGCLIYSHIGKLLSMHRLHVHEVKCYYHCSAQQDECLCYWGSITYSGGRAACMFWKIVVVTGTVLAAM